jgi:hypothetical protein
MLDDDFSKAGDVLKRFFDSISENNYSEYSVLIKNWENIAGRDLGQAIKPVDIIDNLLILKTDHPGWVQKFKFREKAILKEIKKKYPELEIKGIRISIKSK